MSPRTGGARSEWERHADVVIVGAGIAGLTAALRAHARGLKVIVVRKAAHGDTATALAQGGVAVVDGSVPSDSVPRHFGDTVAAGGGLVDGHAATVILTEGAEAIRRLRARGAHFDEGPDGLLRTREGGHSERRIIHAGGDATGAEIQRALNHASRRLTVLDHHNVVAIGVAAGEVTGVSVVDTTGARGLIHASTVVLATGGIGQLYAVTTNPGSATADGIALALRAGATVTDVEFIQFHPTMLYSPTGSGTRPLISEAVRGEGGRLVDIDGRAVTDGDPRGDLAPRDVVARAIATRMRETDAAHVYLDARSINGFAQRFPTIATLCAREGIDPQSDLIPVAPGAHYHCGGVMTDVNGASSIPGLYAVGETARTGLHGANRLASNSLLEAIVVGERVGAAVVSRVGRAISSWVETQWSEPAGSTLPRVVLQRMMSQQAGVVRDETGLSCAANTLADAVASQGVYEDQNLHLTASAIIAAARWRRETRGSHTRRDFPYTDPECARSIPISLRDGMISLDSLEATARV
ncbi:L-aspartate oxidase [Hoyosella subflava]|uniref:L-aspartate oxidase n=1 Tax=Hoyosella subflava (strain DSM 45089 / JCM 17490 / NBRC 109087 / DQS3-9A1) TaxID=443218 RepID=F6EH46_HOYSD|nr:L-aspartate oxidase [Hoyosella subflava]AEF39883.1 L-aspartate oxidase [Hoyosella subflava DQS3-9A1]